LCYYVINSERGRLLIDQLHSGDWRPVSKNEVEILPARPTIFAMYEENIGVLSPMIVDALKDAQAEYSVEWIEEAIKIAVEANVRQWRYIIKILESRKQKGRSHEANQGHAEPYERYITGEWADYIEF
jgi:DnaD/phage-associated family protein